jgi:fatty-acyl-CoA synthase
MMDMPLTITSIMTFAEKVHANQEIVSVTADNPSHRYTFKESFQRARQLANALKNLGAKKGDAIATLAWNDYRHIELYYGISCSGMICHTINPRLFEEQLEYIINHAEDQWVFLDVMFVPLLAKLQDKIPNVKGFVVLTDEAHMPETDLRDVQCYETLIGSEPNTFDFPELDENLACALCYTSGTTGNPKGVLYSHRSTLIHCYAAALPDVFNISVNDTIMPIVPMFHVNGWGNAYSCLMIGAKMVLPGPKMGDGETLCHLINTEKVNKSAGVPTVWMALLQYLESSGKTVDCLESLTVGGAACPVSVMKAFEEKYGVWLHNAWGMTEMSPLGTYNAMSDEQKALPEEELDVLRQKAGRPIFGVDLKIVDADDKELPWDGVAAGAVKVRGPWITSRYFKADEDCTDADGWFETGDVATVDANSFMNITDRTKDVIKSGGEWISSIELENCAADHPLVAEAAVVGISHPRWTERPLLLVVPNEGVEIPKTEMLDWFEDKVAKWWIPTDVVYVSELPHTATGKLSKKDIREQFKDYVWSE